MNKVIILVIFSCFNVFAQIQLPAAHYEKSNTTSKSRNLGGNVLTTSLSGIVEPATATNSQFYLDPHLAGYNNSAADDVNIPACESWSINLIEVAGNYSDPLMVGSLGPAESVSVYIFADLLGEPNTADYANALYVYENLNYTDIDTGDFRISLPLDAILKGGATGSTYWISVRANLAVLNGGQWGWSESTTDIGSNVAQWQQSVAGPLTGINDCVMDWKDRSTCLVSGTEDNLGFALEGQILTKGITVNPTMINLIEGGVSAGFDVSLNAPSCDTVDITIAGNDASETSISPSLLSFNSGNWDIPQTVTLTPQAAGDGNDGDQSYSLTSTAGSVGDAGYNGLTGPNVNVTVVNIEGTSSILVSPSSGITVDEAGTMTQVINFSTSTVPTDNVTIDLTNTSPTEVSLSTSSVVLTAGNGYSADIIITGVADAISEGIQPFLIQTDPAVSLDLTFTGVDTDDITGTVADSNADPTFTVCNIPNLPIPDDTATNLVDTMTIIDSGSVSDINVSLDISHTWVGDLDISLTHVTSGAVVNLIQRPGGVNCNEDNIQAIFGDEYINTTDVCQVFNGFYQPQGTLSSFKGELLTGDWTLTLLDNIMEDTGTLNVWCIHAMVLNDDVIFKSGFE